MIINTLIASILSFGLFLETYPELYWLACNSNQVTEEGVEESGTFSEHYFGKTYREFDRTLMSLHCLEWIYCGEHVRFNLTKEEFCELRTFICSFPKKQLELALVLSDMGKTTKARKLFPEVQAADHDQFYVEAMQLAPERFPSFNRAPATYQRQLLSSLDVAHWGHIYHLEGGPEIFGNVMNLPADDVLFDIAVHLCDVAGAAGHINCHHSMTYNSNFFHRFNAIIEACKCKHHNDAYLFLISQIGKQLGFSVENDEDIVSVRLGAMLRLFSNEEGSHIRELVREVSSPIVIKHLGFRTSDVSRITPTYIPAFLLNLKKVKGLDFAIRYGVPFVAKTLENFDRPNMTNPICFNKLAKVAGQSPEKFIGAEPKVDVYNYVHIK